MALHPSVMCFLPSMRFKTIALSHLSTKSIPNQVHTTSANTTVAAMINPSFGAPAFVAQFIPVFHLKGELMHRGPSTEDGMFMDLRLIIFQCNQNAFRLFHQTFNSLCISAIAHPVPNNRFKMMYTLTLTFLILTQNDVYINIDIFDIKTNEDCEEINCSKIN